MKNKLINSTLLLSLLVAGCSITIGGSGSSYGDSASSDNSVPELSSSTESEDKNFD